MEKYFEADEILLEGMRFYGYHGVHPEERRLGQRFVVDVALSVSLQAAGKRDALDQTVSYSVAYAETRRVVEGEPLQLIEAVAEQIAAAMLALDTRVRRVRVRVAKPEAPIQGSVLDTVAVSISRYRDPEDQQPWATSSSP
jgi:dihydroneopterin aldolase